MLKLPIFLTIILFTACQSNPNTSKNLSRGGDTVYVEKIVRDTIYNEKTSESSEENQQYYVHSRLPYWFIEARILDGLRLKKEYVFDNRINPLYLEEDFNGDRYLDIAIPIKHTKNKKIGFAIIHGKTHKIFIIGAGTMIKNALSDDMYYIDIWFINREKINEAGVEENTGTGPEGELYLSYPSVEIIKSELGGGQLYWTGKEYAYFHQTC